jgi:chromate reductase
MATNRTTEKLETLVDETLEGTFPASDPPSWTLGREPRPQSGLAASSPQTGQAQTPTPEAVEKKSNDTSATVSILGIAGSLRHASYNRAALRAAQHLLPPDTTLDIFELDGIPGFNQDEERQPPAKVVELKARVRAADAILFATPEYNYSIPGVLKNAIDWASRPYGDSAWDGKPVALMGASPGMLGTARAQYHLRQIFVFLNMHPLNRPEVMIAQADKRFDAAGNLIDEQTREFIRQLLQNLATWVRRLGRGSLHARS